MLRNWEGIKRDQEGREGIFHDIPASLPTLLQALKTQKRAAAMAGYASTIATGGLGLTESASTTASRGKTILGA